MNRMVLDVGRILRSNGGGTGVVLGRYLNSVTSYSSFGSMGMLKWKASFASKAKESKIAADLPAPVEDQPKDQYKVVPLKLREILGVDQISKTVDVMKKFRELVKSESEELKSFLKVEDLHKLTTKEIFTAKLKSPASKSAMTKVKRLMSAGRKRSQETREKMREVVLAQKAKKTGLYKEVKISSEMCRFLGVPESTKLSRAEITKRCFAALKPMKIEGATGYNVESSPTAQKLFGKKQVVTAKEVISLIPKNVVPN